VSNTNKNAVVLLSGGLDSATTLAIARDMGYDCYAMTFQYGQRHNVEIECSKKVAAANSIKEHRIIEMDLAAFGGSALTDMSLEVPKNRDEIAENAESSQIPITYVPARNTIFLSYALAFAEVTDSFDIFIGVNATDYSGYPDCRPEFIDAFQKMANLATAAAVENKGKYTIHTPIIKMSKAEIIQTGTKLGVDYSLTHSCYDPAEDQKPCGKCDSCQLRLKGFEEANQTDPVKYVR
jgi:7-cyano-7-deazaguanine synthase